METSQILLIIFSLCATVAVIVLAIYLAQSNSDKDDANDDLHSCQRQKHTLQVDLDKCLQTYLKLECDPANFNNTCETGLVYIAKLVGNELGLIVKVMGTGTSTVLGPAFVYISMPFSGPPKPPKPHPHFIGSPVGATCNKNDECLTKACLPDPNPRLLGRKTCQNKHDDLVGGLGAKCNVSKRLNCAGPLKCIISKGGKGGDGTCRSDVGGECYANDDCADSSNSCVGGGIIIEGTPQAGICKKSTHTKEHFGYGPGGTWRYAPADLSTITIGCGDPPRVIDGGDDPAIIKLTLTDTNSGTVLDCRDRRVTEFINAFKAALKSPYTQFNFKKK